MTNQNETTLNNRDTTTETELEQLSVAELVERVRNSLNEAEAYLDELSEHHDAEELSAIIWDIDDARHAAVVLLRRALGTESEGGAA